jgi:hypothetical protein
MEEVAQLHPAYPSLLQTVAAGMDFFGYFFSMVQNNILLHLQELFEGIE